MGDKMEKKKIWSAIRFFLFCVLFAFNLKRVISGTGNTADLIFTIIFGASILIDAYSFFFRKVAARFTGSELTVLRKGLFFLKITILFALITFRVLIYYGYEYLVVFDIFFYAFIFINLTELRFLEKKLFRKGAENE